MNNDDSQQGRGPLRQVLSSPWVESAKAMRDTEPMTLTLSKGQVAHLRQVVAQHLTALEATGRDERTGVWKHLAGIEYLIEEALGVID